MTDPQAFITKWTGVPASELATSQSFLIDLCGLLDVPAPHATEDQAYMFERPITFAHGDGSNSAGRVDLYRRGCFVLESKKLRTGSASKIDESLLRARTQAENYARALPASEGRPPFLIVVDVGHRIELYSEFSRSGATYTPYPDPRNHRIALKDLADDGVRDMLRTLWLDPLVLDPARQSAKVTREIAARLADLARSLSATAADPERTAAFLQRCLFTMFAEDVGLLPPEAFRNLLVEHRDAPDTAMRMLSALWQDMDRGGFCAVLATDVMHFNGKLFKQPDTLPLTTAQIDLLIDAAKADWRHVEPAIFGTLLERALNPKERHKLGAHYTPRAYVERLVLPTVIEPLRTEWDQAQAAALTLASEGKTKEAGAELRRFHTRLCKVRVLDPACGSGNFLYVTLEHLKRLEGEVLNAMTELGDSQTGLAIDSERFDATSAETVDPHNLLGIEVNARAAAIAELVLWIGYLQWHFRTHGDVRPPQPVVRDFHNIEHRDAVLAWDAIEYETDEAGRPKTRWDGETFKPSAVTGKDVPDESAQVPIERYVNPRKAEWPEADFIVGNPPFIGSKRMRELLGDGYVNAVQAAWPNIPQSTDYVMRWWHHGASLVASGQVARAGLITTNTIRQAYQRRAVEPHLTAKKPVSLVFAVPDHPWVEHSDGAAVRIAMTTISSGEQPGELVTISPPQKETVQSEDNLATVVSIKRGRIHADLSVGADVASCRALSANLGVCGVGMKTIGGGFQISKDKATELGVYTEQNLDEHIRPYFGGQDFSGINRGLFVIDFFGMEEKDVRRRFPAAFQHLFDTVRAKRLLNRNRLFAEKWWVIGHPRQQFRVATANLRRYVITIETAKHRFFGFQPARVTPDSTLVTIALDSSDALGVLSSTVHVMWALRSGGTLEDRPRYNKTRCFECFPFPLLEKNSAEQIGTLAEQLDAHRKRQQAAHPKLTITGMYNVLDKLRSGDELTAKERTIHEQGLVSVLRQLHDELDAAVLEAYGWGDLLPDLRVAHGLDAPGAEQTQADARRAFDDAVLERLVALNAERAAEEARGHVRWLRPEFQNPDATARQADPAQGELATDTPATAPAAAAVTPTTWPRDPLEQVRAVAQTLRDSPVPLTQADVLARFKGRGPWKKRMPALLDMLVAVGQADVQPDGRFVVR